MHTCDTVIAVSGDSTELHYHIIGLACMISWSGNVTVI